MSLINNEIQKLTNTFNKFITDKTADALSTLLGEPIEHTLKILHDGTRSMDCISLGDAIKMCAVRLNGKGDVHIELLYTTKLNSAVKIASKLLGTEVREIDEMGTSALQEVANIMTGSFFNALSENTGFKVDLSTPIFKEGDLKELVMEPAKDVVCPTNDAIITDSTLWGKNTGTEIHMLIIQHPEHARKLITHNPSSAQPEYQHNENVIGGENSEIDSLLSDLTQKIDEKSEIDNLIDDVLNGNNS